MQKPGKLQAVIILVVMAIATGCAATKEYTSKLFRPAEATKDSQATALKFLDIEGIEGDQENWVSTDLLKENDSTNRAIAIEKIDALATVKPARPDSTLLQKKQPSPEEKSVVRKTASGEVREKRVRED